jgi:Flp pilus assembly protein TadG
MLNILDRFTRKLAQDSGQVAIIFALALIPIFTMIGLTIDTQRVIGSKNYVQQSLDGIVLKAARSIQKGASAEDATAEMKQAMQIALNQEPSISCDAMNVSFANDNKEITGKISCKRDAMFGGAISPDKMLFGAASTSAWDIGTLDVAFTFDISGSMATGNRLSSLKSAANSALDTLLPASGVNSDVRIALVAYDDMINAGDLFEDTTGLAKRRTYTATDTYREQRVVRREKYKKKSCRTTGRVCLEREPDGDCIRYSKGNRTCSTKWAWRDVKEYYGPRKTRTVKKTINSSCIWERYGDEKFSDAAPKRTGAPKSIIPNATKPIYNAAKQAENTEGFVAAGYAYMSYDHPDKKNGMSTSGTSCSNIAPLTLTNNRGKLKSYISNLKTRDGTAGHMGVAWAWYLITEDWKTVFPSASAPAKADDKKTKKAIILMSDGQFTDEKFKAEQGDSETQARALCDAIKAQGDLEIYTVAFQAPAAGKAVLEYCASSPDMAFTADDAAQLQAAYQDIAGSLSELRIKS